MMKEKLKIYIISWLCMFGFLSNSVSLANYTSSNTKKDKVIRLLKHPNWKERAKIIVINAADLEKFLRDEDVKEILISLLEKENKVFMKITKEYEQNRKKVEDDALKRDNLDKEWGKYWVYYRDLRDTVCGYAVGGRAEHSYYPLQSDKRALIAVVNSYSWGEGVHNVVRKKVGEIVEHLIKRIKAAEEHKNYAEITAILMILSEGIETKKIAKKEYKKIKEVFIRALKHEDPYIRREAVKGLGIIGDIDVIPLIEKLLTDSYMSEEEIQNGVKKIYPVREEAKKVLKKLEEKKKQEKK